MLTETVEPATTSPAAPSGTRTRRNAALCALVVALALLLTHPVLEMGITDDPSYAHTALQFARTGHFVYNGWATAMLGWQVLWGALFIKLFGFSFTIVRLSMLPIAMATVFLLHQILVRFGVTGWNAVLGTLTLGLSPMFVVLATSFMTDIPGLFSIVLCLYLCQRALSAPTHRAMLLFLAAASATSLVTGTARQIAWLGTLVLVPSTVWLLRRRRWMLEGGIVLWLGSLLAIFLMTRWFAAQPYSVPETAILHSFFHLRPTYGFFHVVAFRLLLLALSLTLFCLPAVLPVVTRLRLLSTRYLVTYFAAMGLLLTLSLVAFRHTVLFTILKAPWLGYTINVAGLTTGGDVLGVRPGAWPLYVQVALAVLTLATAFLFLTVSFYFLATAPRRLAAGSGTPWRHALVLLLPFSLAYIGLLLPRMLYYNDAVGLLDRYLLPLFVPVIILTLRFYQDLFGDTPPLLSRLALALFAAYAIAATHDLFAMDRARLQAAEEVRRSGVPPTLIQGGFEYDFWTQIQATGFINDYRIVNPPGDYHHPVSDSARTPDHLFWYSGFTPALHPRYVVVFTPQPAFRSTRFADVPYRTWLPPFRARFSVQQLP